MRGYTYTLYSPYEGVIEQINVTENMKVYEWESLIEIRLNKNTTKKIKVGISGQIKDLQVTEGQEVKIDSILCKLEDDLTVTGCD